MKSTPPALDGKKRLTKGYPAMTATIVNLPVPAVTYANWFSYTTADFLSQNCEIERTVRITRALFPTRHSALLAMLASMTRKSFGRSCK
jgi:hypothetical protein